MNTIIDPPETPAYDERRQAADLALLRAYAAGQYSPARGRRRQKVILGGAAVIVVAVATAAASGVLSPKHAAVRDIVRCYAMVTTSTSSEFSFEAVSADGAAELPPVEEGGPTGVAIDDVDQAAIAIQTCRGMWQVGTLHLSEPYVTEPLHNGAPDDTPAPELTACVMGNGEVAVYPGPPDTCRSLGLAESTG